jgi:hypothetical protein
LLNISDQYRIAQGAILTYKNDKNELVKPKGVSKVFSTTHNSNHYKSFSRGRFLLVCVYLITKHNITNINEFIRHSNNFKNEYHEYEQFINNIKYYQFKVEDDIKYLSKRGKVKDFFEEAFEDYKNEKIHFYTFWFILMFLKRQDFLIKSRVNKIFWKKLRFLMMFFKFDLEYMERKIKPIL